MAILSAGTSIGYAVETTAGTRPTSGYTVIPEVKTIPSVDQEPSTHQVTPLSESVQHQSIKGLKAEPGTIGIVMNLMDETVTAWETMVTAYEALSDGKKMWFEIKHPKLAKSVFFQGEPIALGGYGSEVDSPLEQTGYISVESTPIRENKTTGE